MFVSPPLPPFFRSPPACLCVCHYVSLLICRLTLIQHTYFSNLGIFGSALSDTALRTKLVQCSQTLIHRGPDWSGYHVDGNVGIAHERLAIIDPDSGAQPLVSRDEAIIVAANGEIYNYQELLEGLPTKYLPRTGSDCECVIPLYQQYGIDDFPNVS